jgi:hypothetical protein
MSIGITDDQMNCNATGHTARRTEAGWQVSWLPGRTLTRNQAITALTLSEAAGRNLRPGDRIWPHAEAVRMARGRQAPERDHPVPRDGDREAGS